MAVRPILLYPDPALLRRTEEVADIDDSLRRLVADLVETMHAAPGIGLAANQVGESRRVCVVDLSAGDDPEQLKVLINPKVTGEEGSEVGEEGCLSFPEIFIDVRRPARATVEALDLDGRRFEITADGLLARAMQHEIEHLDGHVFLDNLSPLKRRYIKKRIRKLVDSGEWVSPTAT